MPRLILLAAALLAFPANAAHRDPPEIRMQKLLAGRVAGAPVDCIGLLGANSTRIIDRTAIIYEVAGRLYVNTPRSGAEMLRDDDVLVTRVVGSRLCSIDSVDLLAQGSRVFRGFVTLGAFVPYDRAKPHP